MPPLTAVTLLVLWGATSGSVTRYKTPFSPMNFHMWYDYVAGNSEDHKATLDEVVVQLEELSTEIHRE